MNFGVKAYTQYALLKDTAERDYMMLPGEVFVTGEPKGLMDFIFSAIDA